MRIPIDYNPGKKSEIRELLLYVSTDQGQTWQQQAVAMPERDSAFAFAAPADGIYWFNMVVIDKSGRREPADIYKAPPALKVLFDTKKPVVSITSAQRLGDEVTVTWKIVEKNPDWSKFRLEYSTGTTGWVPVTTRPEAEGAASFRVAGSGAVNVRLSLTDVAGHTGEASSPVAGTAVAAKPTPEGSASGVVTTGGQADLSAPPTGGPAGSGSSNLIVPPPPVPAPVIPPPTPSGPVAATAPPDVPDRARDLPRPTEPRGNDTPPAPSFAPASTFPPPPGTPGAPPITPIDPPLQPGVENNRPDPLSVHTQAVSNLPPPQVINVSSFKLAYDVEDKGASGVARAEIWVTRDDGRSWKQWTVVDKPESPLLIDLTRNNVQVEGVYGFKVVLQSGAGLSREAPRPGDLPDLRVDVDTTPPIIKIYEPTPDPTQKDTLILRWQAVDRNLAQDPITLEWSDTPRGPWLPIAAAEGIGASPSPAKRLPNTGSYAWRLPSNFPTHKVYLRVSARDNAGNIAEATTAQPVLVDLNKPAAVRLNIVGSAR